MSLTTNEHPNSASCLDANCLDAYSICITGLAATLPFHECRITSAECRAHQSPPPPPRRFNAANSSLEHSARAHFSKSARADHTCARNVCPRPRFFLHHTRHSAKMRIWWPVTSHQVPLFALSGGSWAAKSKATKPPTRPMIKRTRTWSQPNHPPAVLDNFGRWAARPGRPNAKALVDHATILRASEVSPSPPIPVRQPLTCFAHPSKAGRSSHARGN